MYATRQSSWIQQLVFVGPAVLFFTAIVVIPFVLEMYYSFTSWNGISSHVHWIGLANFQKIFTNDPGFWSSFSFTARLTLATVLLLNIVGMVLALLLTQKLKWRNTLRTAFFLPNVIGGLLLGYIWQFIFIKGFASIGSLTHIGLFNLPWLGTEATGFWALVIVSVWQYSGYLMVIYIAGLVNIPPEMKEAAQIDGATSWQVFNHVTVPMIMPSITVCLFLSISWMFKIFDLNFSLTHGSPFDSTESVALHIYQSAFTNNQMGYGAAQAFIFFIIVAIITSLQVSFTKKREVEA